MNACFGVRNVNNYCVRLCTFSLYFHAGIASAEARVSTTANRMAKEIGWENLWLIVLIGLFVIYPLIIGLLQFVLSRQKGLRDLWRFKWFLFSFLIAGMGFVLAAVEFIFILAGAIIFHMNISPVLFYLLFFGYLAIATYKLLTRALREARQASQAD